MSSIPLGKLARNISSLLLISAPSHLVSSSSFLFLAKNQSNHSLLIADRNPFLFSYIIFRINIIIMSELNHIKEQNNLDGILITDNKGFQIYNSGFSHPHHLHSLKQLANFFFPARPDTVIGIETSDYTVVVRDAEGNRMVATRELKEQ